MNYKTSDLYLAAFLRAKGEELENIEKNGPKMTFVFKKDHEELKDEIIKFYNAQGSIEPLKFIDAIRNMKSLTFNA